MAYTPQEILNIASQDFILGNTTVDEQVEFIEDQIKDPFNSGSSNYFKRLRQSVTGDKLDEICIDLLGQVEDRYPSIEFDLSSYDQSVDTVFVAVYKFFIKNIQDLVYRFLRSYIYSTKNRKYLVMEYLNTKIPNYPKEQYGKKEFYILITKLPSIIKDISKDSDIQLTKFIEYLKRDGSNTLYTQRIEELIDKGIICDHGVIMDIFKLFMQSDSYDATLCKLQMDITQNIINPYLEENGLAELRIPPVEPLEDEAAEDNDDEDD